MHSVTATYDAMAETLKGGMWLYKGYIALYTGALPGCTHIWKSDVLLNHLPYKMIFIPFTQRYSHYRDMNSLVDLSSWTFTVKCSSHETKTFLERHYILPAKQIRRFEHQDRIASPFEVCVYLKLNQKANHTRSMKNERFHRISEFQHIMGKHTFLAQVELSFAMQKFFY